MDVSMPVLDGLEATRLIKAAEELREAKVIVPKPSPPDVVVAAVQHAAGLQGALCDGERMIGMALRQGVLSCEHFF